MAARPIKTQSKAEAAAEALLLARLDERVGAIQKDVHEMKLQVREGFVTRAEFVPVRNLVYGAAGFMLIAVLGALVALVVRA